MLSQNKNNANGNTKMIKNLIILYFCVFLAISCVSSRSSISNSGPPQSLKYYYDQLRIKSFTEIHKNILLYLRIAKGEIKNHQYLELSPYELHQQAITIAFSRPDTDDVLFRLKQALKQEVNQTTSFKKHLRHLSSDAVAGIKNENFNTREKATYYFILTNIIQHVSLKKSHENKRILENIYKAKIPLPADLQTHLYIEALESNVISPSKKALKVLKKLYPKKK